MPSFTPLPTPPTAPPYHHLLHRSSPKPQKKYDLVLYGATGFTGVLAVKYLQATYGQKLGVKWAIAGRSADKLKKLSAEYGGEIAIKQLNSALIASRRHHSNAMNAMNAPPLRIASLVAKAAAIFWSPTPPTRPPSSRWSSRPR